MKKPALFSTVSLLLTTILFLPSCSFLNPTSDKSSNSVDDSIVKSFDLVTDEKLEAKEDFYSLTLYAGNTYQIKTTVDDRLGNNYKLTYTKSKSSTDDPYTVSETGLLTMPDINNSIFEDKTSFTSGLNVNLLKTSNDKKLADKFIVITCRKEERKDYANITLTNEDLQFNASTKTYSTSITSGTSYSVKTSISYNVAYNLSSSLVDEIDSAYVTLSGTRIQTNKINEDKEVTIKFETTTTDNKTVLDTIYLKLKLLASSPTPDTGSFVVYAGSPVFEVKDKDVLNLKVNESLYFVYSYAGNVVKADVEITNTNIASYDNNKEFVKALSVGTTTMTISYSSPNNTAFSLTVTLVVSDYALSEIYCSNASEDLVIINGSLKFIGRVFAKYENNKTKDITKSDALTNVIKDKDAQYKTVTLSYNENGVTKTIDYDVRYFVIDEVELGNTAYNLRYFGENTPWNYHYAKSSGTMNMLVIPVWFTNSTNFFNESHKTQIVEDLTPVFNATYEELGYHSVKSYYEQESNGLLTVNSKICEDWYISNTSSTDYADNDDVSATKFGNYTKLAEAACNWYFENNPQDSVSNYDFDNDNKVDTIVLYYGANYYGAKSDNNSSTAFVHHEYKDEYHYNNGAFIPVGSLYDLNNKSVDVSVQKATDDLSTLVTEFNFARRSRIALHEIGHFFGNLDLYTLRSDSAPAGKFSMQDNNVGRHDPFHTNVLGWTMPKVYAAKDYEVGQEIELVLNDIESTKENIVLTDKYNENNSLFDEYLLMEMYSPTGLNSPDCSTVINTPNEAGIRLWHINAILEDWNERDEDGNILKTSKITEGHSHQFANSNFDNEKDLDIVHYIRNNVNETYNTTSRFTKESLFRAGDSFSMEKYASQFVNGNRLDNSKTRLGWEFSVEKVFMNQDGNYGSVVKLTRVDNTQTEFESDVKNFDSGIVQTVDNEDLASTYGLSEDLSMIFNKNSASTFAQSIYAMSSFNTHSHMISLYKDSTNGDGNSITLTLKDKDGYTLKINRISIVYAVFGSTPSVLVNDSALSYESKEYVQLALEDEGDYGAKALYRVNSDSVTIKAADKTRDVGISSIHIEYSITKN